MTEYRGDPEAAAALPAEAAVDPVAARASGPAVELPDPEAAARVAAIEARAPTQAPVRLGRSLLFAFGFATLGAVLWAGVTHVTGYQLGIVAIVVGYLAGLGAAQGGRGRGPQVIGALAGAFGYFLGWLLIVTFEIASKPYVPSAVMPSPHHHGDLSVWMFHHNLVLFLFSMAVGTVIMTFTSLGFVFCGIAVYEGWKIPRAR